MKKFMKGCAITALILVLIGVLLGIAAGSMHGRAAMEKAVETMTGGRLHLRLGGNEWGLMTEDGTTWNGFSNGNVLNGDGFYDIDESVIFDDSFDVLKGNVKKYSLGSDVESLKLEIGGGELVLKQADGTEFYLEARDAQKLQSYVKNGTLYVKSAMKGITFSASDHCKIVLFVPAGFPFDKVEAAIGAGVIELGELTADKVELEVGAGQITAENLTTKTLHMNVGVGDVDIASMQAEKLEAEVGLGHIALSGDISQKSKIECGMGGVEMNLSGAEEDFDYDIECAMGNVEIGNDSYSGLAHEKHVDNGADKKMDIECAMGSVEVSFE